jgi:hypothetical protein
MLSSLLGYSGVIQIREDDARKIMEKIIYVLLKRSTLFLESKKNDTIRKITPWGSKSSFILICRMCLDLIVTREPIHEGQSLMTGIVINHLVDERGWKVVFGTSMVEITKVGADANRALFFVNGDWVGNP